MTGCEHSSRSTFAVCAYTGTPSHFDANILPRTGHS
jgi:hypothetical protein